MEHTLSKIFKHIPCHVTHVRIVLLLVVFSIGSFSGILYCKSRKVSKILYYVTAHLVTYFFAISVLLSKTKYYIFKFRVLTRFVIWLFIG